MINANELRIGNWVVFDNDSFPERVGLESFSILYRYPERINSIKPIALTPEILKKCGFEKIYDGISPYYKLIINRTEAISIEDDWSFGLNAADEKSTQGYASNPDLCKYVHQLQNLYFALTGNELEINL